MCQGASLSPPSSSLLSSLLLVLSLLLKYIENLTANHIKTPYLRKAAKTSEKLKKHTFFIGFVLCVCIRGFLSLLSLLDHRLVQGIVRKSFVFYSLCTISDRLSAVFSVCFPSVCFHLSLIKTYRNS